MMPVNIGTLPIGIICRKQYVIFMKLYGIVDQRQAFIELIDAIAADRRQGTDTTDDLVAHEGVDLVDETGIKETALNGTAPFDEDAGQSFFMEEFQRFRKINGLIVLKGRQDNPDAGVFKASSFNGAG